MGVKRADSLSSWISTHNLIFQPHIWSSTSTVKPVADGVVLYLFSEKKKSMYKWIHTAKLHIVQGAAVCCFYLSAFSKAVQFREKAQT